MMPNCLMITMIIAVWSKMFLMPHNDQSLNEQWTANNPSTTDISTTTAPPSKPSIKRMAKEATPRSSASSVHLSELEVAELNDSKDVIHNEDQNS